MWKWFTLVVHLANLQSGPFHNGFIKFLCDSGKYALKAWKSNTLKRVIKSMLSAETLALEEALQSSFMIKSLLFILLNKELKFDLFPIYCYTDNKSLVDTINSTKKFTEKRLKVDVCIITEMTEKKSQKCFVVWQQLTISWLFYRNWRFKWKTSPCFEWGRKEKGREINQFTTNVCVK